MNHANLILKGSRNGFLLTGVTAKRKNQIRYTMLFDMVFIGVKIWGCGQLLINEIYLFIKCRKDATMLFILSQFINLGDTLQKFKSIVCDVVCQT